ncbi:S8 family peptidase [candidate division KSB1 bacterium]|nr:S8 family peptidase [candidate division KSB1 bacterium]
MIRLLLLLSLLGVVSAPARTALSEPVRARVWVFFVDKQLDGALRGRAIDACERSLTPKARERRIRNHVPLADACDLPVCADYLRQVEAQGVRLRHVSKWLNAVSCEATPVQISQLMQLPFVDRVEAFRLRPEAHPLESERQQRQPLDVPNYGFSDWQNMLCGVPEMHGRGLTGQGVLMCFLDTGCMLAHESLQDLNVVATRDFVFNDANVGDEPGLDTAGQQNHGTATLSTAVGFRDSLLVGPAYGASVMIAKTEWIADEIRSEEDNYVAALEWADSMGADLTSSSLGYILWYENDDLDGRTAVTSQAAVIAARHGILVVTSAGNNRAREWFYVGTPADADSILAVGAVDSFGVLAAFSSGGPTADGRTKPDVCAMGLDVFCASAEAVDRYFFISGTSLSAPIAAGVAALIFEAHPDWTAQQVREAMKATASNATTPDNELGWGIVNGPAALDYNVAADRPPAMTPHSPALLTAYPNPVNGEVTVQLTLQRATSGTLAIYDLLGRRIFETQRRDWPPGVRRERIDAGTLTSGALFARFSSTDGDVVTRIVVLK